jgi:hypothetical protein
MIWHVSFDLGSAYFSLVKARRWIIFTFPSYSHWKLYHYISHLELETLVIYEAYNGID